MAVKMLTGKAFSLGVESSDTIDFAKVMLQDRDASLLDHQRPPSTGMQMAVKMLAGKALTLGAEASDTIDSAKAKLLDRTSSDAGGSLADGSPWSCRACTAENSSQDPKVCRCCCRLFGHEDLGFYFVDDLVPAKSPLGTSALDGMATPLDRRNKARGSSNQLPARRGQARRGTHAR